ncbi:ECF RNA polymerase sigma factor SigK [Paenarthrobacter sp. DKR-5]|uniref:ECF RNA polymerase sigma factor SigK n=1 Tax=Paenarthrobacter sp. DKR-5 TaxID=2835535 RepID=UPI001BDC51AA|nr:ECF RNA polymerase sigma factor SigK [Paenarthrobacter sp. DKR-5]MBT1001870.1 ECF RNA polymerase sigma factor SigK [Paenarthrobacter sp. DKR-5]
MKTEDRSAEDLALLLLETGLGNHQAFSEFYARTSRRVFGLVCRIVVDHGLSEEVVQDVYISVWRDARTYRADAGSPVSWLLTIAHRRAVDKVRSREASTSREARWGAASHSVPYDDVAETVLDRADAGGLKTALASLVPAQREAIDLAYFGGLTYREVAEKLGVPLPTIKSRIRDGVGRLRSLLEAPVELVRSA